MVGAVDVDGVGAQRGQRVRDQHVVDPDQRRQQGKTPTWLAGQVGCQPSLASSPASRKPASSSLRIASWSGVAFMSPTIRSAWSASACLQDRGVVGAPARRVDRGDRVHAEHRERRRTSPPSPGTWCAAGRGRSAAGWPGSSCRRPCSPAPRPGRAAARPGRASSICASRSGVISSSTRRSTWLSRTASTTSCAVGLALVEVRVHHRDALGAGGGLRVVAGHLRREPPRVQRRGRPGRAPPPRSSPSGHRRRSAAPTASTAPAARRTAGWPAA